MAAMETDMDDRDKTRREIFGRRLTALMDEKGWNRSELARQAALHMPDGKFGRDLTSAYANGISIPTPKRLEALCKALGCLPTDLLPIRRAPEESADTAPPFLFEAAGPGKVHVVIDQVVDDSVAADIMHILMPRKAAQ